MRGLRLFSPVCPGNGHPIVPEFRRSRGLHDVTIWILSRSRIGLTPPSQSLSMPQLLQEGNSRHTCRVGTKSGFRVPFDCGRGRKDWLWRFHERCARL